MRRSDQYVFISSTPNGASQSVFDESGARIDEGTPPFTVFLKKGSGRVKAAKRRIVFDMYGRKAAVPDPGRHAIANVGVLAALGDAAASGGLPRSGIFSRTEHGRGDKMLTKSGRE